MCTFSVTVRTNYFTLKYFADHCHKVPLTTARLGDIEHLLSSDVVIVHHVGWVVFSTVVAACFLFDEVHKLPIQGSYLLLILADF